MSVYEVWQVKRVWGGCEKHKTKQNRVSKLIWRKITFLKWLLSQESLVLMIFSPIVSITAINFKKAGLLVSWTKTPWLKNKIPASVFEACLLICSKVSGDQRIFIAGPMNDTARTNVQELPVHFLPKPCQPERNASTRLSEQHGVRGGKRSRIGEAGDLKSLHHCRQHSERM